MRFYPDNDREPREGNPTVSLLMGLMGPEERSGWGPKYMMIQIQWTPPNSTVEQVIQKMVEAGKSACFIGQVLKLYCTGIIPEKGHFYRGGMTNNNLEYEHSEGLKYYLMLSK